MVGDLRAVRRALPAAGRALALPGGEQKTILLNSGAEAVENAVKIARAATGRPAVDRLRARLPRPHAARADDDREDDRTRRGFGPFAPEVYRVPAPYPYPRRLERRRDRGARAAASRPRSTRARSRAPCSSRCRARAASSRCRATSRRGCASFSTAHGILYVDDEVQSGVGRTGRMWAIEHYGVEPDLLVAGKSLGGGLPLASVTGRAELMDAPAPGGLGGTFGGNPVVVRRRDSPSLDALAEASCRAPTRSATHVARAARSRSAPAGSDVRGLGPMLALELPEQEPGPRGGRCRGGARAGLILLSCGLYGNVIRLHVPLRDHRRRARGAASTSWRRRLRAEVAPLTSRSSAAQDLRRASSPSTTSTSEIGRRRVLHAARPVRLRQDDDAADDRRLRAARRGHDPARRRRHHRTARRTRAT